MKGGQGFPSGSRVVVLHKGDVKGRLGLFVEVLHDLAKLLGIPTPHDKDQALLNTRILLQVLLLGSNQSLENGRDHGAPEVCVLLEDGDLLGTEGQ